jgi:hypothetical protein
MATEREGFTPGSRIGEDVEKEREGARDATRSAQDRAREKARDVKERVEERSRELKSEAERRADRWTTQAGEQIERVARALRKAGDALEDEGEGRMSAVSMSVAEQIERMGDYLRDENPGGMIRDFEEMARRNPAAFLGTTFVTGLLLGRFLRASESEGSGEERGRESAEAWSGGLETYTARTGVETRVGSGPGGAGTSRGGKISGWEGDI